MCGWMVTEPCQKLPCCFFCVYLWKICAYTLKEKTIKQHNYHCRRNQKQLPVLFGVRLQCERERKSGTHSQTPTQMQRHMPRLIHFILTSAALWDAKIYHIVCSCCVYEKESVYHPQSSPSAESISRHHIVSKCKSEGKVKYFLQAPNTFFGKAKEQQNN